MEISNIDNDASLHTWCDTYGVEYPTIGTSGNGNVICNTYGIEYFPTVILITPDRQIVIQDLYPIPNAQTIIDALAPYGIQEHECNTAVDPTVEITLGEVGTTTIEATFTPNETCASYSILAGIDSEMQQWMIMMGKTLEELVKEWGIEKTTAETYTWTEMIPNTEYTVYALPMDAEGTFFELQTVIAQTQPMGGTGVSIIDIQVEIVSETSVITTATPDENTAEYHYGLITKDYYDEIGADSAIQVFRNDNYPLHEIDIWTWLDLVPNTHYYAISTGQNANGEWGETTIVPFYTSLESVESNEAIMISAYPNPADDYVRISGVDINSIDIYNSVGQKINTLDINNSEVTISTKTLTDGIYFIRINGHSVKRIVVTH